MAEKNLFEDVPDARGGGQLPSSRPDHPATGSNQGDGGEGGAVGGGDAPPMQKTPAAAAKAPPGSEPLATPSVENYRFSTPLRGRALIITNAKFSRLLSKREFAEVDLNKLQTCLKQLGFHEDNIVIARDLSSTAMKEKLKHESQLKEAHAKIELFMCIIMTHGKENFLYGVDSEKVAIDEVTQLFTGRNCKGLAGKPKVFVMQACHEPPSVVRDSGRDVVDSSKKVKTIRIPSEADFLLLHSWVPGSWAKDVSRMGSWFVQNLVEMLNKNAHNENAKNRDLHNIFQKVILEMSRLLEDERREEFQRKKKQVPYITSTLLRKIIFPREYN